jgi:hypothetical protein
MTRIILSILLFLQITAISGFGQKNIINLAGKWNFKADPQDKGIAEKWYLQPLDETVNLPGSMTENGKGNEVNLQTKWTGDIVDSSWFYNPAMAKFREPGNFKIPFWLQPVKSYVGAAWYQKTIEIPVSWKGQNIQLFLERCHWETRVWVDGKEAGIQNALGAPHRFDLTSLLSPGKHSLAICVDNRVKDIKVGMNSHSISDHTQSNWNGIVGKMELRATNLVFISDVKVFPDIAAKKVKVQVEIINKTNESVQQNVQLIAIPLQQINQQTPVIISAKKSVEKGKNSIEMDYPMGDSLQLWDEFHPALYTLHVSVSGTKIFEDTKEITFGMREFKAKGSQFTINGRPTFLRGTLECAIFPKTGYPPTDTASWGRVFRIAKAHGLNHFRFHSWCPPEAAFIAADLAGIYLHIECSSWANQGATIGDGKLLDQFIYDESERIVNEFGNHPSFCIMLYGNEPAGNNQNKWLGDFENYWRKKDNRRLYSSGAGWPNIPESDFYSTPEPRIQGWGQGLKSTINSQPPRSDYDWHEKIASFDKPVVSHEIGQWCVYPDFKEITQYTGVLKAKNFEIFEETLNENNMASLADSFLLASGKLQALCYKADIEAALRTPGFGGFQLLDLHDFPGQGTALVGVLSSFWTEKGYITPNEYHKFCNSTVPLVRLPKMIYSNNESLVAHVEIAHFGEKAIINSIPTWKITDSTGKILLNGNLPKSSIPIGNGIKLGEINQSFASITQAQKLTLTVTVDKFENDWDIWVYPATLPEIKEPILVTHTLNNQAIETLNKGGEVLLTLKKGSIKPEKGGSIAVGFSSIFWNTAWTGGQAPHTLGILCDPKHPALANFPTDYHSNWEWWDAMSNSNAIILSDFPVELKPIVRIIDDWVTNRPLGLIFEAKVGNGKLLISGADLLTNAKKRPEARQLLFSLKNYMAGNSFNPAVTIELKKLKGILN